MKLLIPIALLLTSTSAFAKNVHCKVTQVDNNGFIVRVLVDQDFQFNQFSFNTPIATSDGGTGVSGSLNDGEIGIGFSPKGGGPGHDGRHVFGYAFGHKRVVALNYDVMATCYELPVSR